MYFVGVGDISIASRHRYSFGQTFSWASCSGGSLWPSGKDWRFRDGCVSEAQACAMDPRVDTVCITLQGRHTSSACDRAFEGHHRQPLPSRGIDLPREGYRQPSRRTRGVSAHAEPLPFLLLAPPPAPRRPSVLSPRMRGSHSL